MLKAISKLVAYKKAPVWTFALLHPFKAVKWIGIFFLVSAALKRALRDGEGSPRA